MTAPVQIIEHEDPAWAEISDCSGFADLRPFGYENLLESLHLRHLSDGLHELCCLPFRTFGLALGDAVELDLHDRVISRVIRRSGARVFRFFIDFSVDGDEFNVARRTLIRSIEDSRLISEWSGDRHAAVHVPADSESQIGPIWQAVQELDPGKRIYWEWGEKKDFLPPLPRPSGNRR